MSTGRWSNTRIKFVGISRTATVIGRKPPCLENGLLSAFHPGPRVVLGCTTEKFFVKLRLRAAEADSLVTMIGHPLPIVRFEQFGQITTERIDRLLNHWQRFRVQERVKLNGSFLIGRFPRRVFLLGGHQITPRQLEIDSSPSITNQVYHTSPDIVELVADENAEAPSCTVTKAEGAKCTRRWCWGTSVGKRSDHPEMFRRCVKAVA